MQEVALAAIRQQAPLGDADKVAPWLYRLAVTQSLLYRRRQGRWRKLTTRYAERERPTEHDGRTLDPLEWLLADERQDLVRQAIARLPRREVEILLLKYTENWSYEQLAQHLGTSESAIESRAASSASEIAPRTGGRRGRRSRTMTILDEFRRDEQPRARPPGRRRARPTRAPRSCSASLDDEPGAWRHCALAFLEAQNWRWQLSRVASEPLVAQLTSPPRDTIAISISPARQTNFSSLGAILAIAASLLVAFGIGTRFPSFANDDDGGGALVAKQNAASVERQAGTLDSESPMQPSAISDSQPELVDTAAEPLQTLTLKPIGDDGGEPIELPLIESDADGAIAASARPSALSGSLISEFEKDGFVVDRQQRLWPVDLPDGRRVLVPVEEVDIRSPQVERL